MTLQIFAVGRPHGRFAFLLGAKVCLKALKPREPETEPQTLGEHIKRRRRELGLTQKQAALQIGVTSFTLLNWEKGKTEPMVQHYPAIMGFLGYCPYERGDTFAKQIRLHRTHQGLSHRALAKLIDVDPGSISRWESGERKPFKRITHKLWQYFVTDIL